MTFMSAIVTSLRMFLKSIALHKNQKRVKNLEKIEINCSVTQTNINFELMNW